MAVDRVKLQQIVASQLPRYVSEDFPLLTDFLEQYYVSLESQGGPSNLIKNIDQYVKVDELTNLETETTLTEDIDYYTRSVKVESTYGFVDTDGIIKIDDEIFLYETKTLTSFENVKRGFSGITSYITPDNPDRLTFETTQNQSHQTGAHVQNLNVLFLQQFFKKLKKQVVPGFSDRNFYTGLDEKNFIFNSDSFYASKGTDQSFEILFRALYGEDVEVIKPSQFLLTPSNANYKVTKDFVVEKLQGDPLQLQNLTLFQQLTGARGSVTNVQQIPYDNFQYYQISIDSGFNRDSDVTGSIYGKFEPDPQTKILNQVGAGQTYLDVDSTVGFPQSGTLEVVDVDLELLRLKYDGKTSTQFFNVSGVDNVILKTTDISLDSYAFAYVGIQTTKQVKVRFTGSLSDFEQNDKTHSYKKDDTIQLRSLGYEAPGKKNNNYSLNIKTNWQVKKTTLLDASAFQYGFEFYNTHFLQEGYKVVLENIDKTMSLPGIISRIQSSNEIVVTFQQNFLTTGSYIIENQTLKGNSIKYPYLEKYTANIQNTYAKYDGSTLIASNSIPKYNNLETNPYDRRIVFSATLQSTDILTLPTNQTTIPDHAFYTGDALYLESKGVGFEGVVSGAYFIYRVDESRIKLSRSKADLARKIYITFNGSVTNAVVTLLDFYQKEIAPQGIYREIPNPINDSKRYITNAGFNGIFNNGVEILNYKSQNSVYYGNIEDFTITAAGEGYDVINPPVLIIQDDVGIGATGVVNVKGQLERLDILDKGLGYYEAPFIRISGGNGTGAAAEARMTSIKHENAFLADGTLEQTRLDLNQITFSSDHKFLDGESIIYQPRSTKGISGLTTDSEYFCSIHSQTAIKLHNTKTDALVGINTVDLIGYGVGTQFIVASEPKSVVSSVIITNPGKNYESKKRTIPQAGINTALNTVNIKGHGYQSKEIVRYNPGNPLIVGLSKKTDYYVVKVTDDAFSLTEVGIGTIATDYYFNNGIIINFTQQGEGSFNYQPITVSVEGAAASYDKSFVEDFQELFVIESPIDKNIITPVQVLAWTDTEAEILNSLTNDEFYVQVSADSHWLISDEPFVGNILLYDAELQPIFRGGIQSIDLLNGGVGYGSSEIIDFRRQPSLQFQSGTGAVLQPIISNGQISEVVVLSPGVGYNSPPDLNVISANTTGKFAVLTPVLNNGRIQSVFVVKGGLGYESGKTSIDIIPSGRGTRTNANIRGWNINLFERYLDNILEDDGILAENISNKELQYSHLYASRALRESSTAIDGFDKDNKLYGTFDLRKNIAEEEIENIYHSPILGWAYDGNPIYGPYGFKNQDGTGFVKRMVSSYKLKTTPVNRPSFNTYPNGFFVDDYIYAADGDLDEHNGRFCVTPDFPNGIYAYFCTISEAIDSSGPFQKFRRPVFPYVIGNTFRSVPSEFNYKGISNQTDYDIESNGWFRNTTNYYTNAGSSGYDYIYNSNNVRKQSIDITATSRGTVDSLTIIDGGDNYQVNDTIILNETDTQGRNCKWRVNEIKGKRVNTVSLATTAFNNVTFVPNGNKSGFVAFTEVPHKFDTNDIISVDNLSEDFKGFSGSYNIGVTTSRYQLVIGIASASQTGVVTFMNIKGIEGSLLKDNDILTIESERIRVLELDKLNSRIKILREQDNTIGASHSAGLLFREETNKFVFNTGITTSKKFRFNQQYYFDPHEQVGVGSLAQAGAGVTLGIKNPGAGTTLRFVREQMIYLPGHGMAPNTPVVYSSGGNVNPMRGWSGIETSSIFTLADGLNFFATPLDNDHIGISTNRIGLNSEGLFIGAGTTLTDTGLQAGIIFFTSVGAGDTHSFTTNRINVLKGRVSKNVVTVSVADTHGLSTNDFINFDLNPKDTQTISVVYNEHNRRMVFDPDVIEEAQVNSGTSSFIVPKDKYLLGDKIIYSALVPSDGLVSEDMYYVYPIEDNRIKLIKEISEINNDYPAFVNIGTAKTATFSKINPRLTVQQNRTYKFDLSSPTLGFTNALTKFSAFSMKITTDDAYIDEFLVGEGSNAFEVIRDGEVGVSTDASLSLRISANVPKNLFYKFDIDNIDILPSVQKQLIVDKTVPQFSQINQVPSKYDGSHQVVGVATDAFQFNVFNVKDLTNNYNEGTANMSYTTNSRFAYGPIHSVKVIDKGVGYQSLPGFEGVTSKTGTGALIEPNSNSIGQILDFKINNIGFGYPSDKTLKASGNTPEILKIEPLAQFDYIGITSAGVNYFVAPELVVIDGLSKKQITDVQLDFELGATEVKILKNTISLNNVTPDILPINNPNGFSIGSMSYFENNKIVRLYLNKSFSTPEEFPFKVGEKIIVENIAIGFNTDGKGYNSDSYEYTLFPLTGLDAKLGGSNGYVEYSLADYLSTNEYPGNVTSIVSAYITPKTYFPIFDIDLKVSDFFDGERVSNGFADGTVERWDPISETLFVSSNKSFLPGTIIQSDSSQIKSVIKSRTNFNTTIKIGAGATVIDGWQTNSGVLNDNLQVLPNNEYYQNFSYSLKSRIDLETWEDAVSALNHTAGFKKYADLIIENEAVSSCTPVEIDLDTTVDLIGEFSLSCFPDFDGGTERTIDIQGSKIISDTIVFSNKILLDYFESRGNRVLNLSLGGGGGAAGGSPFDDEPREEPFESIANYENKFTHNKILTLVQDAQLRDRKQSSMLTVMQDGTQGYINQYGMLDTVTPLGHFDYRNIQNGTWSLDFYPVTPLYNNYEVTIFSFSQLDNVLSIGATDVGSVVRISTGQTEIAASSTTEVISIGATYRSAKVIAQLHDFQNDKYYGNEINLLHDGTNVTLMQYGDITSSTDLAGISGFGTFIGRIDSGNIVLDFKSTVGTALSVNAMVIAISDQNASGIGTIDLEVSNVSSYSKSIAASATPIANVVGSYYEPDSSGYFVVSVEDITNNEYECFEVMSLDSLFEENFVEFARVNTGTSGLGTVGFTSTGNNINLTYTPVPNINVEVRAFAVTNQNYLNVSGITSVNLENNILFSKQGTYTGQEFDKATAFPLLFDGNPVFGGPFLGNNPGVVNTATNQIVIPNHNFITGEKVKYTPFNKLKVGTENAISIASTDVPGVGITNKLPEDVYAIKYSDVTVGFAKSAADALATVPIPLNLTSVGIGSIHTLFGANENARCLIAIDNMIQAPITEVKIETQLLSNIIFEPSFRVVGIQSFKSNDLIQINNEIMLLQNIGVGRTNNFNVVRAQMGTEVETHVIGDVVKLLGGNYNITENTIHFAEAPYGNTPIGTTTQGPDEVDWQGITTSSTFQGRTFMRSGVLNGVDHTYKNNYTFDNIQSEFNGFDNEFLLTVNGGDNVAGFATNQAIVLNSNILQEPTGAQESTGDFTLNDKVGVTTITYTGTSQSSENDPNRATIPRGGNITAVGSTQGFGYQPLVGAGASVFVNSSGHISSIAIGNSGSGYRAGIQTHVSVGILTSSTDNQPVIGIGTAYIVDGHIDSIGLSTTVGTLDINNPPVVVIDKPLPYSNLSLVYSGGNAIEGIGTGARVDITVGQGSSVIDFTLIQGGFAYGFNEILTVSVGGTLGIPLTSGFSGNEFQLTIDDLYRDTFNGWTLGELDVFDKLDPLFDGETTKFNLSIASASYGIETADGSNVDLNQALIVTINDVLQIPGESYNFAGGSIIEFSQPPARGDSSKVIFYKGTPEVDVVFVDILETVKVGDTLQLMNDPGKGQNNSLLQEKRTVVGITTLDTVKTFPYAGPGITTDISLERPIEWCKQKDDLFIDGRVVAKDRVEYEPLIYPAAYIINDIGPGDEFCYVDTVRPLFDSAPETQLIDYQFKVTFTDQTEIKTAIATASITNGSITGFNLVDAGKGYATLPTPEISIGNAGFTSTGRATATASAIGDVVGNLNVINPGVGYTVLPHIIIETPPARTETVGVDSYFGDYGQIVGVAQSNGGLTTLEFYIPDDSFMRDPYYVGVAVTLSEIGKNDYFVVNESNVGLYSTVPDFDGIYRVEKVYDYISDLTSIGAGVTMVRRVEIQGVGVGSTNFSSTLITFDSDVITWDNRVGYAYGTGVFERNRIYGEYTWGKVSFINRSPVTAKRFTASSYPNLDKSPLMTRSTTLKYNNYTP